MHSVSDGNNFPSPTFVYHDTHKVYVQFAWGIEVYKSPAEIIEIADIKTFDVDHTRKRMYLVYANTIVVIALHNMGPSNSITSSSDTITGKFIRKVVEWIRTPH